MAAAIGWGVVALLDKGADAVGDKPPVNVYLDADLAEIFDGLPPWQTYSFVVPESGGLPRPPSSLCRTWQSWAYGQGGVDADQTLLQLRLQGRADTAAALDRVGVEIVKRNKPIVGTQGYCPAGGAVGSPRQVDIDLDTSPPTVLYAKEGDDYPARRRLPLTLSGPETETLEIRVHTHECDCAWRLKLRMVVDGEQHVETVENGDQPFRTTASSASRHFIWQDGRWQPLSTPGWKGTLPMRWAGFSQGQAP